MAECLMYEGHTGVVLGETITLAAGSLVEIADGNLPVWIAAGFKMVLLSRPDQWQQGMMLPPWCMIKNAIDKLTINSAECYAWYFGRAPRAYIAGNQLRHRWRVVNGQTGITWSEMFIAKGILTGGGDQTLTVVGTVSSSASVVGIVDTNIPIAAGQSISPGDDLWLGFAKLSSGSPDVRSGAFGDDLQRGLVVNAGNVRPSLIVGTPTLFTVAATSKETPQFAVYPGGWQ
jgi:hypothetical protein